MNKRKESVYEKMYEMSLEDNYNILCRNEPHKNSKKHKEWDYIESIAYEELLDENENVNKCNEIIKMIIEYVKNDYNEKNI